MSINKSFEFKDGIAKKKGGLALLLLLSHYTVEVPTYHLRDICEVGLHKIFPHVVMDMVKLAQNKLVRDHLEEICSLWSNLDSLS